MPAKRLVGSRTAPAGAPRGAAAPSHERVGIVFYVGLLWILFDIGRPPTPPMVPLLLSAVMFFSWLGLKDKQWSRQSIWWLVILAVVGSGLVLAENTYEAFLASRLLGTLFLMVCLPLQAMVNSVKKLRVWIYGFILVTFYVGAWAVTHSGFGPAGTAGQDENYVATLMGMGIALSYFSIFAEKRLIVKLMLGLNIVVGIGAMALAFNPSRGGFLALCAVAAYCLWRSPKKMIGLGVFAVGSVALLAIAGPGFWKEIESTTDYETGTGDTRIEVWKAGMRMWADNPVLGVGAGNFRWRIGDYQSQAQLEKFGRSLGGSIIAHSLPVETLAELGSVGALAVILLVGITWKGLGRVLVPRPPPGEPSPDPELVQLGIYADALRAAMIAVLINSIFLSLLYYSHLWVLVAVGSAVPFVRRRILARSGQPQPQSGAVPRGVPLRGGLVVAELPPPGVTRLAPGGRR